MAATKKDDEVMGRSFDAKLTVRALQFIRPYRQLFLFSLIMLALVSAANVAKPYLLKVAIDSGIGKGDPLVLTIAAVVYLVVFILRWVFQYMQSVSLASLSQHVSNDIRNTLFRHIQSLSLDWFNKHEVGRVISRLMSDVASIDALIVSGAVSVLNNALTAVGVIFVMGRLNIRLALLTFSLLPFIVFVTVVFRGIVRRAYREVRARVATVTATVAENVSGVRVVKSYSREKQTLKNFRQATKNSRTAVMRSVFLGTLFGTTVELLTVVGVSMVFWYGGLQVVHGHLTLGGFVAFTFYVSLFYQPITAMSQFYAVVQAAMAGAERIFEVLDTQPEVADGSNAIELPRIEGHVEFRNVAFGYDNTLVLSDASFLAKPGETIAIVGPTGAGKTTMIGLLARQYDVKGGAIVIDGHDVREVTLKSIRRQMGVVLQDSFLFPGTIADNIRYGKLDATQEEVEEAATAVGAHEFIMRMSNGYKTEVNEGGWGLSTGQKQILSFARALIADPRILVLDEATSSVDTKTEQMIQAALARLLEGRTSFVIAHRLSTITQADQILLIQDGVVAERGRHHELIQSGGHYQHLFEVQFAGFAEETST